MPSSINTSTNSEHLYVMKRGEYFNYNYESKKPKLHINSNNVDDIWGEDPEIEEFDKCVNLATQICNSQDQQQNYSFNSTINYDKFKQQNIHTSTQALFKLPSTASTSKCGQQQDCSIKATSVYNNEVSVINNDTSNDILTQGLSHLKAENKKLIQIQETKNGEIAILRSQLLQAQKQLEHEKLDKMRSIEATTKKADLQLITTTKNLATCKSESDLKDLEIANLKDKLAEMKKSHNSTLNSSSFSNDFFNCDIKRNKLNGINSLFNKDNVCVQTYNPVSHFIGYGPVFPLQELVPKSYFDQSMHPAFSISHNFHSTQGEHCLNSEVILLMKCTEEQLNSSNISACINKILFVVRESLLTLYEKLQHFQLDMNSDDNEMKNHLTLEEDEDLLTNYCIFSKQPWCINEIGIDLRRCIAVSSVLTLYSEVVHNYFSGKFYPTFEYNFIGQSTMSTEIQKSDFNLVNNETYNFDLLNILLNVVNSIEKSRRAKQFTGVFASILKLFSNIARKGNFSDECCILINSIFKKNISARPSKSIMKYIAEFLRCMSEYSLFVVLLCKMSNLESRKRNFKGGFFPTDDICTLKLLTNIIHKCKRSVDINFDILQFLLNTVTYNVSWLYCPENERCTCLAEIYNIASDVLYNSLEDYLTGHVLNSDKTVIQYYKTMFRVGIIFLDILVVRHPDLIGRYSRLYYQYQAILKKVNNLKESLNLEVFHRTSLDRLLSQLYINEQTVEENPVESNTDFIFKESFTF